MVRSLVVAMALAIAVGPDSLSAQVTADLHTMSRPHVVGPAEGQQRILPDGRAMLLKVGPSTTGAAYLFLGAEDLPPGASVPRHRHELDEEILIVQRGDIQVELNDTSYAAAAGSVVYLPPRTWIRVRNPSAADTATIMFVFPRGSVERCFQYVGRSPAEVAAGEGPVRTEADLADERQSCQMTYQ